MIDLLMAKWLLVVCGIIYLYIIYKLSLKTRFLKYFMIYGGIIQGVFLIYYFYTAYYLMNYPKLPIPMSEFSQFFDLLVICFIALLLPIYGLTLFHLSKKMSQLLLIVTALLLLPLCYIFLVIFILMTYGFAP